MDTNEQKNSRVNATGIVFLAAITLLMFFIAVISGKYGTEKTVIYLYVLLGASYMLCFFPELSGFILLKSLKLPDLASTEDIKRIFSLRMFCMYYINMVIISMSLATFYISFMEFHYDNYSPAFLPVSFFGLYLGGISNTFPLPLLMLLGLTTDRTRKILFILFIFIIAPGLYFYYELLEIFSNSLGATSLYLPILLISTILTSVFSILFQYRRLLESYSYNQVISKPDTNTKPEQDSRNVPPTESAFSEMRIGNKSITFHPIIKCLREIECVVSGGENWVATNEHQRRFLADPYKTGYEDTVRLNDEIKSLVSQNIDDINGFFVNYDMPELNISQEEATRLKAQEMIFVVAAIMRISIEWFEEGEKTSLISKSNKNEYPAVTLEKETKCCEKGREYKSLEQKIKYFHWDQHSSPIAAIPTKKEGEQVFMTIYDPPENENEMYNFVMNFNQSYKNDSVLKAEYKNLRFPMIDYMENIDISWLEGMRVDQYFIQLARQFTKFRMDEKGAGLESGVEIAIAVGAYPKTMVIDSPFLLWIQREELHLPLFIGYFTEDHWKNPNI